MVAEPVEVTITFEHDSTGRVTGLLWQENRLPVKRAGKVAIYREEKVSYRNGETTLAASLFLPAEYGRAAGGSLRSRMRCSESITRAIGRSIAKAIRSRSLRRTAEWEAAIRSWPTGLL